MSRKFIKKSFQRSAEYSAALVFGVLFLFSSTYGLPNFSVNSRTSPVSNDGSNKQAATNVKVDSGYRKYCNSDDHTGKCSFTSIYDSALNSPILLGQSGHVYIDQFISSESLGNISIRAPPTV